MVSNNNIKEIAQEVIRIEAEAVSSLSDRIDGAFEQAIDILFGCKGRVIVTGVGKSGLIARKIASTLASTGTAAFFVHAAEALHGDLGNVRKEDVVLAVTKSGRTPEISGIVPQLEKIGAKIIIITGSVNSPLAKLSDVILDTSVKEEACPHDLAPTASSTAALVMGDALAVVLLNKRGFSKEDFALFHPGGNIGKKLLMRVKDIMSSDEFIPIVHKDSPFSEALVEMNSKRFGSVCLTNDEGELCGIFTDGDLRRELESGNDIFKLNALEAGSENPKTVREDELAIKALKVLEDHNILQVIVVADNNKPIGMIHLHDLLKAGIK